MSSSSSVQTELSHTAESHDEEDVFDDAVSTIESVRASWAPQVDERERASAEHRHRERLVAYQKRQSMRIEAERELLERHLRLGHEDARREAARKAELLAAEMAREQQELMRLLEHEVQRAQQRRAEQQARDVLRDRWCADHDWLSIKVMWADARNDYADVVARVRRRAAECGG